MGAWGLVVSNVWLRGDHVGGRGGKERITLRQIENADGTVILQSSTVANPEDFVSGNHEGTGPGWVRAGEVLRMFSPSFNFVVDSIMGDTVQDPNTDESAWISMQPSTQYSGTFGIEFLTYSGAPSNPTQLGLAGNNVVTIDTTYNRHQCHLPKR